MLNSAADTFGETQIDPLRMAIKYDNTLYAALAHRFHRVPDQDADLEALLGILELSFTHISLLTEVLTVINLAATFNNTVHLFELSNELNENTITI